MRLSELRPAKGSVKNRKKCKKIILGCTELPIAIFSYKSFKKAKESKLFIEPTTILTDNPKFRTMCEEIFGPVLTIYLYDPNNWKETLTLVDTTSDYALTGCVMGEDMEAVQEAKDALTHSAGNFYINDKPTGAVVGRSEERRVGKECRSRWSPYH